MLKRTINTSEVEKREKKARHQFEAFKTHITEAIGEYESAWYYQWHLSSHAEYQRVNPTYTHPRVQNVTQLKSIISKSTEATKLADDLVEYVDGSNDNFSWAWFSPLRDYVRYAVEDYSYSDLQSYDADMKFFVMVDSKSSLGETEESRKIPIDQTSVNEVLNNNSAVLHKIIKSTKEKNQELEQKAREQEAIIQDQESLIKLLRDIISELLIQITTFREVAHSVIGTFGDILAQIGEYFNLKSERENQNTKSSLVNDLEYLDHEVSTPSTPKRSENSESSIATPSTVDRQGKNWQNALPLWLNEVGVKNIDDFEAASSDLNHAIFTAEGSAGVLNASNVYNPDMTYEYLDYRSGMEAAVTEQIEQKEELDADLQTAVQRCEELALENEQLRIKLQQAEQQLAQQNPSSSDAHSDNAAPPPPPPPGPPPPPEAKAGIAAPLRFFRKKKEGEEAAPGLPRPDNARGPSTPTDSATAPTDVATGFKDELNSKVKARLTKTGIKFTPTKKQIYGTHQQDPLLSAALANRFRGVYGISPKKSPSQKTPTTPVNSRGDKDLNSSIDNSF
ncbi:MAG: hypothetical protein K2X50_08020 [Gammaproteobacteria bacterium]|nr:hypothetical protein [Gammaproteobacteria bacterium]